MDDPPRGERVVTVGVCSRNRPESLARCLRSLGMADAMVEGITVYDDGSEPPLEPAVRAILGDALPARTRFVRSDASRGLSVGRNRIAREAGTPYVLNLDDDAMLVTARAVADAVAVLRGDESVAAVAFAQSDAEGTPWPAGAQPAPVDYACVVPSFIGYAHLLRRDAFLAAGGFREGMRMHGEEKDLCMRLMERGLRVVYLPDTRIAHLADPAGRDRAEYLFLTIRNDVLGGVYNEPLPVLALTAPARLSRYFRMRRGMGLHDPGGFGRILRALGRELPAAWGARHGVGLRTWRRWRRLLRERPRYQPPAAP
ncbi:MAG: family 2 glycosyl transferase [Gemmatimonadetes bacterium]|nr:family 2 glycosyl transferase [Gemmatimonadota bacterium]